MFYEYVYGIKCWDMYPGVTVSIEIITPETAMAMLEANVCNRDEKREPLVAAIENGEWKLNGETIVFSDEGVLLDGQNRLNACVRANKPIVTLVVRGIAASAQITMDTGVKRTVADFLKMKGYSDCTFVGSIGTALLKKDIYGIESIFNTRNGDQLTVMQIVGFIDESYESRIKPIMRDCRSVCNRYKGIASGALAALFEEFKNADIESYSLFIDMLMLRRDPTGPLPLLIAKLSGNSENRQGRLPQKIVGALIAKTWNAYMKGESKVLLKFTAGGAHPEQFPEIFKGWE
ncbi:MAG: hypothetical protein IKG18_08835 [Atopobiaceae bacterium]|nr:hypothetical protein [Atopobiaceae bacterium]MBR4614295.1 hypothetical protein [Kiritimatiellia bacterium]